MKVHGAADNTESQVSKPDKSYVAVLILGENTMPSFEVREQFQKEGYFLLGDGTKEKLRLLNYEALKGKIGQNTRVYILAHGTAKQGFHFLEEDLTELLLGRIAEESGAKSARIPLNIQLFACFAGAAASNVGVLPAGSVLVAHSPSSDSTSSAMNDLTILASSSDLRNADLVQDFIVRFALNTKQTETISIHRKDGSVFQHAVRPPERMLTDIGDIKAYLHFRRVEFIDAYNKNSTLKLDTEGLLLITDAEAKAWRWGTFIQAALTGDKMLAKGLEDNVDGFSEYINDFAEGKTALMLAASEGHAAVVAAMLTSAIINVNARDAKECTALMLAAENGQEAVISVMLASNKIDIDAVNKRDNDGNTAFMLAAENGRAEAVAAFLTSSKTDAALKMKNYEDRTALMLATIYNHASVVSIMLASDEIDKADISMQDLSGLTAFMMAAREGHVDVVAAFLASPKFTEADLSIRDSDGNTALELAEDSNHPNIASLIKSYTAKAASKSAASEIEKSDSGVKIIKSDAAKLPEQEPATGAKIVIPAGFQSILQARKGVPPTANPVAPKPASALVPKPAVSTTRATPSAPKPASALVPKRAVSTTRAIPSAPKPASALVPKPAVSTTRAIPSAPKPASALVPKPAVSTTRAIPSAPKSAPAIVPKPADSHTAAIRSVSNKNPETPAR